MERQIEAPFGPPLIGQTERALDAILVRELEGTGLSPTGWVLLRLASAAGGTLERRELVERSQSVAKFDPADAEAAIDALISAGFLEGAEAGGLTVTGSAQALQARIDSATRAVTTRLWGDLPESDLAAAGRVLSTVLDRANAELGYSI